MSSNCGLFAAWALFLELTMCFTVMSPLVPTNMDLFPGEFLVSSVQLLFFVPVQQCSNQNCCVKAKKCPAGLLSKLNFYTTCHNSPLDSHMLLDLYYDFLFLSYYNYNEQHWGMEKKKKKNREVVKRVNRRRGREKTESASTPAGEKKTNQRNNGNNQHMHK